MSNNKITLIVIGVISVLMVVGGYMLFSGGSAGYSDTETGEGHSHSVGY